MHHGNILLALLPETSETHPLALLHGGLGEEAVETVIAACSGDEASIVPEAADLMFHLAVLLADAGLSLDDVRAELERREGVGGLVEKAARTG